MNFTHISGMTLAHQQRFLAKIQRTETCWLWLGKKNPHGYGVITVATKAWLVHRLSYTLTYGQIPTGMHVLHSCDTPACLNPAHLHQGTQADNMREMAERKRSTKGERHNFKRMPELQPRGERHGNSMLTAEIVRTIRQRAATGERQRAIAQDLGYTEALISQLVLRKTWKHV